MTDDTPQAPRGSFEYHGTPPQPGVPVINGHPCHSVTGFDAYVAVGELPAVTLTLIPADALSLVLDDPAIISVSDETREALISLGWTPPGPQTGTAVPDSACLLTLRDPEPPPGTVVRDCHGDEWRRSDEDLKLWWQTRVDGDPESWAKIAGNYGPVTVISEPVQAEEAASARLTFRVPDYMGEPGHRHVARIGREWRELFPGLEASLGSLRIDRENAEAVIDFRLAPTEDGQQHD